MLDIFWSSHNATRPAWSQQYASIIFFHDEEQRRLASASKEAEEARRGQPVYTTVVSLDKFYMAEDYHQKYYLRSSSALMQEFEAFYPDQKDFVASTAVARANGFFGGNGTTSQLEQELAALGLSPAAQELLRKRVSR